MNHHRYMIQDLHFGHWWYVAATHSEATARQIANMLTEVYEVRHRVVDTTTDKTTYATRTESKVNG